MKKLKVIIIAWIAIIPTILYGQVNLQTNNIRNAYDRIHGENIYIHQNASLLLAGEQLYYKIYCIDPEINELSPLSKIGYVELIGKNNHQIFKHKIKLISGLGQGDFFIPTTVPSGNYKILGYTEWMKNFGKEFFFQADLCIINPYQVNEKSVVQKYDTTQIELPKKYLESTTQMASMHRGNTDKNLKLIINKSEFATRSKATISIQEILDPGNYSISVRKKEITSKFLNPTSKTYKSIYENKGKSKNENIYLPELRGELIYGNLVSSDTNSSISGKKVALSIPGKEFVFQISTTNEQGLFYFNLNKVYNDSKALLHLMGDDKEAYQIMMIQQSYIDQSGLVFKELKIAQQTLDLIVQRSIHNQVENAYLKLKQDSIKPDKIARPFYMNQAHSYNLDDYTRFATVKETIFEMINEAWTKKNKKDKYIFQVRGINYKPNSGLLPLVLLDGNLIQDHNNLINSSADKIKNISVFKERFSIGTKVYQGFISFETYDGYTQNNISNDNSIYIDLLKPQPKKIYFNQSYETDMKITMNHIPDYRYQLLWMPNLNSNGDEMVIEFFTSDITGDFEISIEGFTNSGLPVSLNDIITVK